MKLILPQAIVFGLILSGELAFTASAEAMAETQPAWYNCLTSEAFTVEEQVWCDRWQTLQNAAYLVPNTLDSAPEYISVMLENGRYQRGDEQFIVELVGEPGWIAFGDINGDGKEDAAVIFGVALDPEGRSIATYLTAVLDVDGVAEALMPIRLGERIMLNAPIAIANNQVTVPFLTQTEAFDRHYSIDGLALVEASQAGCP